MKRYLKLALTAAVATAAAGAVAHAQAPKKGGILQYAVVAEPPTYDCHATTTFATLHPVRPHYSGLLKFVGDVNKKLEVVGDLKQVGGVMLADWEKKAGADGAAVLAAFRKP